MAGRARAVLASYWPLAGVAEIRLHDTPLYDSIYRFDDDMLVNTHVYGILAVFSDPAHVIAYAGGEVRQPVNTCFTAQVIGGTLTTSDEASEVAWVPSARLDGYDIHPAILRRIAHGLQPGPTPHVG